MAIDNLLLPKGRVVSGNPASWEQATDYHTKQVKVDKNGQPLMQNWCHIAIPKADFLAKVWPIMVQEAMKTNPNAANVHPDNYLSDKFAWKVINGDSPMCAEGSKTPYNQREGFPGHYIIKLSTYAFAPGVVVYQNGAYHRLNESQIKTGDYVVASVKLEAHAEKSGGLYWNPNVYELVELGGALSSGESGGNPQTLLGDASTRSYAGFQGTLPVATMQAPAAPVAPPAAPQMPQQMQPMAPQMPQQMGVPQYQQPLPAAGYVHQGMPAPMAPQMAPAPLPPPARDYVQNVGQYPAPAAGYGQPQLAVPQAGGFAPGATSFPTNSGIPGIPPSR